MYYIIFRLKDLRDLKFKKSERSYSKPPRCLLPLNSNLVYFYFSSTVNSPCLVLFPAPYPFTVARGSPVSRDRLCRAQEVRKEQRERERKKRRRRLCRESDYWETGEVNFSPCHVLNCFTPTRTGVKGQCVLTSVEKLKSHFPPLMRTQAAQQHQPGINLQPRACWKTHFYLHLLLPASVHTHKSMSNGAYVSMCVYIGDAPLISSRPINASLLCVSLYSRHESCSHNARCPSLAWKTLIYGLFYALSWMHPRWQTT